MPLNVVQAKPAKIEHTEMQTVYSGVSLDEIRTVAITKVKLGILSKAAQIIIQSREQDSNTWDPQTIKTTLILNQDFKITDERQISTATGFKFLVKMEMNVDIIQFKANYQETEAYPILIFYVDEVIRQLDTIIVHLNQLSPKAGDIIKDVVQKRLVKCETLELCLNILKRWKYYGADNPDSDLNSAIADLSLAKTSDFINSYIYFQKGLWYLDNNYLSEALQNFTDAIELNQKSNNFFLGRALCYEYLLMKEDALVDYNRALDLEPKGDYAHFKRGRLYLSLGDPKSGIKDLNTAIHNNENFGMAYNQLAIAYEGLKQMDLAQTNFQKLKKVDLPHEFSFDIKNKAGMSEGLFVAKGFGSRSDASDRLLKMNIRRLYSAKCASIIDAIRNVLLNVNHKKNIGSIAQNLKMIPIWQALLKNSKVDLQVTKNDGILNRFLQGNLGRIKIKSKTLVKEADVISDHILITLGDETVAVEENKVTKEIPSEFYQKIVNILRSLSFSGKFNYQTDYTCHTTLRYWGRSKPDIFYSIHISSFRSISRAKKEMRNFLQKGYSPFYYKIHIPGKGLWYRVCVGKYATRAKAQQEAELFLQKGYSFTMIDKFPKK